MRSRLSRLVPLAVAAVASASACRGGDRTVHQAVDARDGAAAAGPARTASRPADGCGWISAADIEALIGPLAGPPTPEGDACRYPLALDSQTVRKMARLREVARRFVGSGAPAPGHDEAAVVVQVDLTGGIAEQRAEEGMAEQFAAVVGPNARADESPPPSAEPSRETGWDYVSSPPGAEGFVGRVGHITVTVSQQTSLGQPGSGVDIPREKWRAVAARVRDRIPDLPFAVPPDPDLEALFREEGSPQETAPSHPDPCSLLTRAEAEAVLGTLVVAPYRSQGALSVGRDGPSCAYFTAGHHALVVTPQWSGGSVRFSMARGVAGVAGQGVARYGRDAEVADTLEGPWDQAVQETDGTLAFLEGDRMLEIDYLTSSTDASGAVRLARLAFARLAAAAPHR